MLALDPPEACIMSDIEAPLILAEDVEAALVL